MDNLKGTLKHQLKRWRQVIELVDRLAAVCRNKARKIQEACDTQQVAGFSGSSLSLSMYVCVSLSYNRAVK